MKEPSEGVNPLGGAFKLLLSSAATVLLVAFAVVAPSAAQASPAHPLAVTFTFDDV